MGTHAKTCLLIPDDFCVLVFGVVLRTSDLEFLNEEIRTPIKKTTLKLIHKHAVYTMSVYNAKIKLKSKWHCACYSQFSIAKAA